MKSFNNDDRKKIGLFVIFPFFAFLISMKNLKSKSSFIIFFLFNALFGFTFVASDIKADSYSYVQEFFLNKNISLDTYIWSISDYFSFDSNIKDIYVITCDFLVSRITFNYHILFALYASVFSFFFLKSFKFLVERPEFEKSVSGYLLIFLFVFSNPIYNINGVRFWTAAWMTVYVLFEFIVNGKYNYLFWLIVIPLVHIAYFNIVIFILLYLLFPKKDKYVYALYLISFFVGNVLYDVVAKVKEFMPLPVQNLIWSYTEDFNITEKYSAEAAVPLYAKILLNLPYYYLNLLVFLLIKKISSINRKTVEYSVLIFLMFFMSFVNFTISIPSFGARFLFLVIPFITYLCLALKKEYHLLRSFIYMAPIVYAYPLLYWFRSMIKVTDIILFAAPFPVIIVKNLFY